MEFHTYEDFRANLSITIEVMPAPNGIYVPDHPPNSYVMNVGITGACKGKPVFFGVHQLIFVPTCSS